MGSEPEVSHCKPCLCLLFHGVQKISIFKPQILANSNASVNILLQASVFDVVLLLPASHAYLPALPELCHSAGSNAAAKHHYVLSFKVHLHRAENETPITDEANALLIIDPDVAWILSSMWVFHQM